VAATAAAPPNLTILVALAALSDHQAPRGARSAALFGVAATLPSSVGLPRAPRPL